MKLSPVHFLIGKEPLQQKLVLEEIRMAVFPLGSKGLNDDTFDLKTDKLTSILDLANTYPMLAQKRLIQVRNVNNFSDVDENRWLTYLENPSPHTVLIALAEKLDKRKKLYKALDKKGFITTLTAPRPRDLSKWIDRLAKRHQIQISPGAKNLLADALGTDLSLLDREIEKLALYAFPEKTVTEKAVEDLVLRAAGGNIFSFTDQVVEKRLGQALHTLSHLVSSGTPPLILVTMLARHFRILLKAQDFLKNQTAGVPAAQALGVPAFTTSRYLDQARQLSILYLRNALATLRSLDRDLKSTGLPAKLLLERSLRDLTRRGTY